MNEHRGLWHAKRLDTGEWVEGYYVCISGCHHYIYTGKFVCGANEMIHHPEMLSVDPSTLGECTGLTDKNGKLIFEGDIVESYKFGAEKFVNVITLRNGCFWYGNWNFVEFLSKFCDYEVIGNIHDNPEPLEREAGNDAGR